MLAHRGFFPPAIRPGSDNKQLLGSVKYLDQRVSRTRVALPSTKRNARSRTSLPPSLSVRGTLVHHSLLLCLVRVRHCAFETTTERQHQRPTFIAFMTATTMTPPPAAVVPAPPIPLPTGLPAAPLSQPNWVQGGFIRDDIARDHVERNPNIAHCLQTLVVPVLGDRTYTELVTNAGVRLVVTGTVISIGPLPTNLYSTGSLYWKLAAVVLGETAEAKLMRIYNFLGALHGQRIIGSSSLVEPSGRVVKALVVYVFNDNMINPWTVEGIWVVEEPPCDCQSGAEL
jgi:hypothetical protein